MAEYNGKQYDPDEPLCQDDYEWLTETGAYAHEKLKRRLLPAKNRRRVEPRVCATCHYGIYDGDGGFQCKRDGATYDTSLGEQWGFVCDRYHLGTPLLIGAQILTLPQPYEQQNGDGEVIS